MGFGANPQGGVNLRTPPTWDPERDAAYSFEQYCQNLMLWSFATDLHPPQILPAVILNLRGAAIFCAREMTPHEMENGGTIDGQHYDALPYLIAGLQARFAPLPNKALRRP